MGRRSNRSPPERATPGVAKSLQTARLSSAPGLAAKPSCIWYYRSKPIHRRVGPDGALYLVDFYNQIAVHNDTRGPAHGAHNAATRPDRNHHFTRLYRIQHKEAQALPAFELNPGDPPKLVEMLE